MFDELNFDGVYQTLEYVEFEATKFRANSIASARPFIAVQILTNFPSKTLTIRMQFLAEHTLRVESGLKIPHSVFLYKEIKNALISNTSFNPIISEKN